MSNFFFIFVVPCTKINFIINNQRDSALSSLIYYSPQDYSTCFGCSLHPSSGVNKNVDATTGTSHVSVWYRFKSVEGVQGRAPSSLSWPIRNWPRHSELGSRTWTPSMDLNLHHTDTSLVPVIASTFLCTPDDGCREHPKHVE